MAAKKKSLTSGEVVSTSVAESVAMWRAMQDAERAAQGKPVKGDLPINVRSHPEPDK